MRDIPHRIWRRLPYRLRRRALFAVSSALAPGLPGEAQPGPPVIVAGFLRAASGLGRMARLLYEGYARQGVPVCGVDLTGPFRQGAEVDFSFVDAGGHRGPGTVVLVVNAPFVPLALAVLGRGLLARKWRIGYWAWELPAVPPEWRVGAGLVHEIWAVSSFSASAIEAGLGRPVRVVLPPLLPPKADEGGGRGDAEADFVALLSFNMASSFARKNPLAGIAAFKAAFADDRGALLIVKVAHASAYPTGARQLAEACQGHANISLLAETGTDARLAGLLARSDVVLSLHRSEGLGLQFGEAMHLGKAIVATGWSGNLEILDSRNSCLVPASLVPARDPQGTYDWPAMLWAEPSVPAAAEFLRRLRSEPALRERQGRQARADAARLFKGPPRLTARPA